MIVTTTVLVKTDAGREALAKRSHGLTPRQRALLISINGELDIAQLRTRFAGGAPEEMDAALEKFLDAGLIEAVGETGPVAAAGEVPAAAAAARGTDRAASAAGNVVGDWRRIQTRATDLLREVMGADADLLAMRIERARTEQEFLTHLERSFDVVDQARGADTLAQYRAGLIAR
jgi:hypothetical protein